MKLELAAWLALARKQAEHTGRRMERLIRALEGVYLLHQPGWDGWCAECARPWPCSTASAIASALGAQQQADDGWNYPR